MYSLLLFIFHVALSMVLLIAAMPTPQTETITSSCVFGALHCCHSVQDIQSISPANHAIIHTLLISGNISEVHLKLPVGLACGPLNVRNPFYQFLGIPKLCYK